MKTIPTSKGEIRLLDPTDELLGSIRSLLPFGVLQLVPPQQEADFGIVMQCGDSEICAVKQQPVDTDQQTGNRYFQANNFLIAHSLTSYVRNGFGGLLMPCAYRRTKERDRVEAGIAYFGAPSRTGREAAEFPYQSPYDDRFDRGFTTMITSFFRALAESSQITGIPLQRPIGLEIRKRLELGTLGFGFMVVGPHIVCVRTHLSESDPTWAMLRSTGLTELYHLPSAPFAIRAGELERAKPLRQARSSRP